MANEEPQADRAGASMPRPGGQVTSDGGADLKRPDTHLETGLENLPWLEQLPSDWVLISLHSMAPTLQISTTLPQMWESYLGKEVERAVVRSKHPLLFEFNPDHLRYVVDAMPRETALEFFSWVGSQVFCRRRGEGMYVECNTRWGQSPLARDMVVVTPVSAQGSVEVIEGSWPLQFKIRPAPPGVISRAASALNNPQGLVQAPNPEVRVQDVDSLSREIEQSRD
jgi:hypothetical protein